jgi:hypothetical protein
LAHRDVRREDVLDAVGGALGRAPAAAAQAEAAARALNGTSRSNAHPARTREAVRQDAAAQRRSESD